MQTRDYVMEVNVLVLLKGAKGKKTQAWKLFWVKDFQGFIFQQLQRDLRGSASGETGNHQEFYLTSVTIELPGTKGRRAPHSFTTVHLITKGACMCVFMSVCTHTRASVKAALCCASQQSSYSGKIM